MTYKEAHRIIMADADFDFSKISPKSQQTADALCVAVNALERQIAKKPINKTKPDNGVAQRYENCNVVICPSCDRRLKLKSKGKYCDKCGQRIDWERGEQNDH